MKVFSHRYLPINLFVLYSIFVFCALIFGPAKYYYIDYLKLFGFLFTFLFLFYVGFIFGAKKKIHPCLGKEPTSVFRIKSIFRFFLYISVIIALADWAEFILSGKDFSLASMGETYVNSYKGYERGQANIGLTYVLNILLASITMITLLLIFSHYRDLKTSFKYLSIFVVFSYLIINVAGSGKQKYLGDIVIFLIYANLIKIASQSIKISVKKISIAIGIFIFIIGLFSFLLYQRYSAINLDGTNISTALHPLMYWDESSLVIKIFGDVLGFAIGMFLGYFTNGLYGLNLSLQLPFEWTYFIGNSYSTTKVVEFFLGDNGSIISRTYPYRAGELGWGQDKWHSIFSWLASDFTFFGVLVLSFLFAFIYGRLWINSIRNENPAARPFFIYMSLGVIFAYSNNQLVHSLSGVFVLLFLSLFYFVCKRLL